MGLRLLDEDLRLLDEDLRLLDDIFLCSSIIFSALV
jgi:hypothetical protein